MTAEMDVYGGEVSSPNGHANVGGSYVFVNGNGNGDPLDSDPTSKQSNTNPNLDDVEPSSQLEEKLLNHADPDQENQQPQPHYSANAHHQESDSSSCPVEAASPNHQIDTQQTFHTQEGDVSCSADSDNVHVQTSQTVPVAAVSILDTPTESGIGFGASTVTEDDGVERETETGKLDIAGEITSVSHPVDNDVDSGPVRNDSVSSFPCNGSRSETETALDSTGLEGEVSTLITSDSTLKSIDGQPISVDDAASISVDNSALESGSIGKESSLPSCPGADVKMGSELENKSVVSFGVIPGDFGVIPGDDGAVSESDILNGSVISSQTAQNCVADNCVVDNCVADVVHEGIPEGEIDDEIQLTSIGSDGKTEENRVNSSGGSDGKTEENGEIEYTGGSDVKTEENGDIEFTGGGSDNKTCQEAEENVEKTLQESEVRFTGGENKTCQEGEIQCTAGNDDQKGQEGEENVEISEENGDKTGQEGEENGEIQFTCVESDDKISQKLEDNVEIQFTGEESNGKACMDDNSRTHGEIQFTGEGSGGKTCQEGEENRGEEIAEVEENRETQFSDEGSDGKTCQEGEENRGEEIADGEENRGEEIAEGEENREIQFTGEGSDGKTCPEGEENRGEEIADGEENKGEEIAEGEENREIQFTGEGSDGKTCQEGEENRGEEIAEGEENRGEEIAKGEENRVVEIQEGEENRDGEIQEVQKNMEGEIQFTDEGIDDRTCQKIEDGEIRSDEDRTPQNIEVNGETQFTDGERDDRASQFIGGEGGDKAFQEVEGTDGIHRDETPSTAPEGSTLDASEMQNSGAESEMQSAGAEVVKRPFYFLIKVPRYDDENLREQIKCAQLKVDEKTKSRDVIRAEIQTLRDAYKKYGDNLEAAMSEEKAARESLKSKRQEIDSLQSMINKVKNAISMEDTDGRIRNMEHMIAHETLALKEEKQFIREIKQLRQLREQFSSSMGKQDEVQQAFDQKDQIEERLKLLRKEADSLRENVLKAEAATQAAKKKQKDESEKLRKLYTQFKEADDVRQEAYKHLQSLRKQAYDKNKYFWKYKDDIKQANDLVAKGDKEALQHLCVNQVEGVLELWNNNNEFREQYVSSNIRSTLRRLKTLDGRSLGPDEVPPVIPTVSYNKVAKDNSVTQITALKEEKTELVVPVKSEKVDDKPIPTAAERKNQTAKSNRPAKVVHSVGGSATVSGEDEIEEARDEVPKRTKEEEELARKAEELRKEEEAARLKEQRRLEEKIKAKEALERKKRIAEKAQTRATLRAQKEAEEKEKEREKRARKKEKRKAAEAGDTDLVNEGESAPSMETTEETPTPSEVREKSMTVTKRPQKLSQFTKQTKVKSIPLPLRNRGKRRMQTWMWVMITTLVAVALFLLGNSNFPVNFGLQGFGF